MHRKKLIIIGRGRGANKGLLADGEKWSANFFKPGADVLFNIHKPTNLSPKLKKRFGGDIAKAIQAGQRLILQNTYPLKEIIKEYGIKFFPQSITYMIALGIYRGFEAIDLYGCNIIPKAGDEPIVKNHPGTEFWVGFAMGRGIEVKVQGGYESFILRDTGLYGFEE